MSDPEIKGQKERDYHVYLGWKIPVFIKLAWGVLLTWCVVYFVLYALPDLKVWLEK
jgi:hypothetical protein